MTVPSALEVFEKLKAAINDALQNEGFNEVLQVAEKLRMAGGLDTRPMSLSYRYEYRTNEGQKVDLHVRSYDPSGPFQTIPDINRFTATLHDASGKEIQRIDQQYSD